MESITQEAVSSLEKAGRTVTSLVTLAIGERAGLGSNMKLLTGGKLRPDRFEVITAEGLLGREVVVWPMMAATPLPGEYHVRLPGALRASAVYKSGFVGTNWSSEDNELQSWLRKETFEAHLLPNDMKQGLTKLDLEHVIDLFAESATVSRLVMTLGGIGGIGTVKKALTIADRLAPSIALSTASGASEPLGGIRYAGFADAAFTGTIETLASPSESEDEANRPVIDADVRVRAIVNAATPHAGKRVVIGAIDDAKRLANVFSKVAPGADPGSLVAFFDTGMRANGKAGIAFLPEEIRVTEMGEHRSARYEDLRSVKVDGGKVIVNVIQADGIELLVGNDSEAIVEMLRAAIAPGDS